MRFYYLPVIVVAVALIAVALILSSPALAWKKGFGSGAVIPNVMTVCQSCFAIDNLTTINATPQGQSTVSGYSLSGGLIQLAFSAPHTFANNGTYSLVGTGSANCDTDWRITVIDATHVTLQNSGLASPAPGPACNTDEGSGLTIGATMAFMYAPGGGFDEADYSVIGTNSCLNVEGKNVDCAHTITLGAAASDRGGIAKVVFYMGLADGTAGTKLTVSSEALNTRTNSYGFLFTPQSGGFSGGNAVQTVYADIYPVNGFVRRVILPGLVVDTSNIATPLQRNFYYVDAGSGADTSCGQTTSSSPWKTIRWAGYCAAQNSPHGASNAYGGDIIFVNPATVTNELCNTSNPSVQNSVTVCPQTYTFNQLWTEDVPMTVTSGTYGGSGQGPWGNGAVPSATKWTLSRSGHYSSDNYVASYRPSAHSLIFDNVNLDLAKYRTMTAARTPDPNGIAGSLNLQNCTFINTDDNGWFGIYNGTSYNSIPSGTATDYAVGDGEGLFSYQGQSFYQFGSIVNCGGAMQAATGAALILNSNFSVNWDIAFYTFANSALVNHGPLGPTGSWQVGAISGYRTFHYQPVGGGHYWENGLVDTDEPITSITHNAAGNTIPAVNWTTVEFAQLTGNGTFTSGTGSFPAFSIAGGVFQSLQTGDRIGWFNSGTALYEWQTFNFTSSGPGNGSWNPSGQITTGYSAGALSGQSYIISPVLSITPSTGLSGYGLNVHFTTGTNAIPLDPSDIGTTDSLGFTEVPNCNYWPRYAGSGTYTPLTTKLNGTPSLTVTGGTVTMSVAGAYFYKNMIITAGGGTATVVDMTDTTHFTITGSTIPNGTYTNGSQYTVTDGSVPTLVMNGDATLGCHAHYYPAGGQPGCPGGQLTCSNGQAGASGPGAVVGDHVALRQPLQHPDVFQFQGDANSGVVETTSNIYNQSFYTVGNAQPLFLVQRGALSQGAATITTSGKNITFSSPVTLYAYEGIQVNNAAHTFAIIDPSSAGTGKTSAKLLAPLPTDVTGATYYLVSMIEGFFYVDSIMTNRVQNYSAQYGNYVALANTAIIQSDLAISNTTLGAQTNNWWLRNSGGLGVNDYALGGIAFFDSILGGNNADATVIGAGAQPNPGYTYDNYCVQATPSGSFLPGTNGSSCTSATFSGANFSPSGLSKTAIGKISGSTIVGPPLFPRWIDDSTRTGGGVIGAMHP